MLLSTPLLRGQVKLLLSPEQLKCCPNQYWPGSIHISELRWAVYYLCCSWNQILADLHTFGYYSQERLSLVQGRSLFLSSASIRPSMSWNLYFRAEVTGDLTQVAKLENLFVLYPDLSYCNVFHVFLSGWGDSFGYSKKITVPQHWKHDKKRFLAIKDSQTCRKLPHLAIHLSQQQNSSRGWGWYLIKISAQSTHSLLQTWTILCEICQYPKAMSGLKEVNFILLRHELLQ